MAADTTRDGKALVCGGYDDLRLRADVLYASMCACALIQPIDPLLLQQTLHFAHTKDLSRMMPFVAGTARAALGWKNPDGRSWTTTELGEDPSRLGVVKTADDIIFRHINIKTAIHSRFAQRPDHDGLFTAETALRSQRNMQQESQIPSLFVQANLLPALLRKYYLAQVLALTPDTMRPTLLATVRASGAEYVRLLRDECPASNFIPYLPIPGICSLVSAYVNRWRTENEVFALLRHECL